MNIICQSLYYQYILDKFHFLKSPKTFRVMSMLYAEICPKVRRHNALPSRALCLLTFNANNTAPSIGTIAG